MSEKKLLPCPFCGGEACCPVEQKGMGYPDNMQWVVDCSTCTAAIYGSTAQEASDKWNTRAGGEG